jgi:hypothetical protein
VGIGHDENIAKVVALLAADEESMETMALERMETMALKGKPRDMNKWREVLLDPDVHFPGESGEYRRARNELLEAEAELRRLNEQVATQRRALPAGGLIREDYIFEYAADGSKVRFSELFAPGKNSLVIYNMMFPRWSEDPRAGAPWG